MSSEARCTRLDDVLAALRAGALPEGEHAAAENHAAACADCGAALAADTALDGRLASQAATLAAPAGLETRLAGSLAALTRAPSGPVRPLGPAWLWALALGGGLFAALLGDAGTQAPAPPAPRVPYRHQVAPLSPDDALSPRGERLAAPRDDLHRTWE